MATSSAALAQEGTANLEPLSVRREGSVAIVEVRNPPVNALSQPVRRALLAAFTAFRTDASVQAIVLAGADGRFVAGADIGELDSPPVAPALRDVIAAMDLCPQPIFAAIEGAALGGGFELALACDVRIASADASVGLPELKLGFIPGAGGTQRLPRLLGASRSISLITSTRAVPAVEARLLGLLDQVTTKPVSKAAALLARSQTTGKRRLSEAAVPAETIDAINAAAQDAIKKARGQPAAAAVIKAVEHATIGSFEDGVALEQRLFLELRGSAEAAALRHLFFAERQAAKIPGLQEPARELRSIGVVGAGTMGSGIAIALATSDLDVCLIERDAAALQAGIARIDSLFAGAIASKKLDADAAADKRGRIQGSVHFESLRGCDLVIEAVFEDLEVKKQVFQKLVAVTPPSTVLATNTSFIDVDALAASTDRPSDIVGLHFFSPAHVMKLLEIVRGHSTSQAALATSLALARRMGKLPVVAGVCDGFIGNRISQAYRRQCEFMLEEGATPLEVDAALEAFGFAMGPFAVSDLAGLDISWARRKAFASRRDTRERYVPIADVLCEQGRFGQKTAAGWYSYPNGARKRLPDLAVLAAIEAASTQRGLIRRPLDVTEIQQRALAAMVNEAALVVQEGIAQRPSDIDVVFVNGYGFPATKGGPLFWASRQPAARLANWIELVGATTGFGFRRAEGLAELLTPYRK